MEFQDNVDISGINIYLWGKMTTIPYLIAKQQSII